MITGTEEARCGRGNGAARVDAATKVCGDTKFAADRTPRGSAYAALAVSTINRGRIDRLDIDAARAVPGVRLVLTPRDLRDVPTAGFSFAGGYAARSLQPMTLVIRNDDPGATSNRHFIFSFSEPSATERCTVQINGHHLTVSHTCDDVLVTPAPAFTGVDTVDFEVSGEQ